MVDIDRYGVAPGAWAALEGAFAAMKAGGLPCGAALADETGAVVVRGRNHAYDPATGDDLLEETPIAHAELNVLARVATSRDLSRDTLWSTQQPCSMCSAALRFCGIGEVRFLAADPAFIATDDPRAGTPHDPTSDHPELTIWAIVANALFLQPAIGRNDAARLDRNRHVEPETVLAAEAIAAASPSGELGPLVDLMWNELRQLADRRRQRFGRKR